MPAQESFEQAWSGFRDQFQVRAARLADEVTAAWDDVRSLTEALAESLDSIVAAEPPPAKIESLEALFGDRGKHLLSEPLAVYRKKRPLQRVLSAIEQYDAALDDLVRQLPAGAQVSGRRLVELVAPETGARFRKRWLGWQESPRSLGLRNIVSAHLRRDAWRRAVADGAFQVLLAKSSLHLLGPWHLYRRHLLSVVLEAKPNREELEGDRRWWRETAGKHNARAARLVQAYRDWAAQAPARLARTVLRRTPELSARQCGKILERRQGYFGYWSRQQRAVRSVLDLEEHLLRLGGEATGETAAALASLESEHAELIEELDAVIQWLEASDREEDPGPFPPPQARMLAADERVSEWVRNVCSHVQARMPVAIETVAPRRALPGWKNSWRRLEPRKALSKAVERTGREAAGEGFRKAEAGHRAIVREIERAREVVAFGLDVVQSEGAEGLDLVREGVANALSLLLYQKRTVVDPKPTVENGLARAQAQAFLDASVALEEGRLGHLAYLTRQSGRRAAQQIGRLAVHGLQVASRGVWAGVRQVYRWVLLKTGWVTPLAPRLEPVTERAYLGQVLALNLGVRDLPMLYRRLFRLAPVEDARFLVGRDGEMAGLAEALSRWQSGRGVSVIVVGARGSGKTSLLNCAAGVFAGIPIVRSQFCQRITDPERMRQFLTNLFGYSEGVNLEEALAQERRVVILEEFERTFLRTMNGFAALRDFLRLLSATSTTTLWILSVNETSFRYLDAVVGLSSAFSHRVNAMSVRLEDITNAILQRHNLSGLRLQFAPPPEGDPRVSQARRLFGLEADPQTLFFEALYEQSEGLFRSAFELWQDCIERVEGGLIHMKLPLDPNYRSLRAEMTTDDFFTLQALLQHGSLTAEELAQVLGISVESGRERLGRMLALELLEPEPVCPGLRVLPQAARFVRDALHRQNLL